MSAGDDDWRGLAKRLRNDVIQRSNDVKPVAVRAREFLKPLAVTNLDTKTSDAMGCANSCVRK